MQRIVCFFIFFISCSVLTAQETTVFKDSLKTHLLIKNFHTLTEKTPEIASKKIDSLFSIVKRKKYLKSSYYYHFYNGYYHFVISNLDSSFIHFKKATFFAKKFKLKKEIIESNNWIANLHTFKNENEKAQDLYHQNNRLSKKIAFTEGIISSYFGLASLEIDKEKSLTFLIKIDSTCKKNNYKSAVLANTYESIASIYLHNIKNRKKGIEYLQLFLETSKEVNYYPGVNYASKILGNLALEDKKYTLATKYFNENLIRNQKSKLKIGIVHNLISLATVNIATKKYQKAKKGLLEAITILKEIPNNDIMDFANLSLAETYIYLKEYKKAEFIISSSEKLHPKNTEFRKLFFRVNILFFTTKKEYKKAVFYQRKLLKLEKTITKNENLKEFLALENKYKATERKQQIQHLETTNKKILLKNKNQKKIFISFLLIGLLALSFIVFAYKRKQQSSKDLKEEVQTLKALNPNKKGINSADKRFLLQVEEIIATKILDPTFSAVTFAESVHLSRMQLHRKLKKITQLSTSEFIKTERLKVAEKLLLSSESSISEIAYHCGFKDTSYFSKQFKSVYKKSPSSYRNS